MWGSQEALCPWFIKSHGADSDPCMFDVPVLSGPTFKRYVESLVTAGPFLPKICWQFEVSTWCECYSTLEAERLVDDWTIHDWLKQQSILSNVLRHWVCTMSCFLSELMLKIHKWYLILLVCKDEVSAAGSYQAWYSVCRQQEVSIVSCRSVAYRRVYSGDNLMILSLYVTHSYVKMQCMSDIES